MKRLAFMIFCILSTLATNAQPYRSTQEIQSDSVRRVRYKQTVNKIFKEDELFVLFYLNLALVVDPIQDSQIVETITTENPWESLTKYLNGKSNIYFCPSGNQLNVAIEYMPCPIDKDILMSDRYGMYRLSSPEELFKNRGEGFRQRKHKAVVFGGLKYDEMSEPQKDNLLAFRGKREAVNGYEYLRSTYEEAIYIDSIFRKNGIETALLTGKNGTEESFEQIHNSHADILHIASHGEYNPDKDNLESSSLQEWMMSHSWLALSGADKDAANGGNDGRLTAYEISQTDLTGVNLVVLSACDTGLGDVKENDVYGLLKGFKKAGAGTMLVSLSEVNDTVTGLMMKRFYDNLFRGDNPRRALENAQRYIRLHGNGQFNKPEYWASFILTDDLDRNIGSKVSDTIKESFLSDIINSEYIYSENALFPNWELVRKNLKKDDVVLRIFPYQRHGDIEYVTMIGDVANGRCQILRLFLENDAFEKTRKRRMRPDDINLDTTNILLWNRILPLVKSKKRFFIQAAGLFNNLPIESSPKVVNKYQIYRITSLESLKSRNKNTISSAVLYGGLSYDSEKEYEFNYDTTPEELTRGSVVGVHYLYGTLQETENIAELFSQMNINVAFFHDEYGTEASFKKLSNKPVQIIHLATHAFGIDFNITNKDLHFLLFGEQKNSIQDHLLCFSGLCMSGFNNYIKGNPLETDNNGILSGDEISHMNLNSVELVTLSACGTAKEQQEKILTDEPWNLIKSFKLAGVKSFLASLWDVSDEATCYLMIEFYKNWITKNMTKHDALELAKQTVQSHKEKGWDAPKYWAAFVLLDALE